MCAATSQSYIEGEFMNYIRTLFTTTALCTLVSMAHASPQDATKPYRFIQKIDIEGDGGWDYLTIDSAARAASGNPAEAAGA